MPNTIAENLQRLIDAKTAIGSAITAKGGTVGAGDGLEEFAADIATIPSGGGGSTSNAVNFYDYDGTIVQSYSAADFANLSELPANPSHEGLTAQGWNWSLADAKMYVNKYGKLNIGQMYVTSDGKTRIYITLTEGRISPILQLYLNANTTLDIDWGDGGSHSTFTSTSVGYKNERHNYATPGNYVIAITVTTGSFVLRSSSTLVSSILWNGNNTASSPDSAYNNSIQKIEIGTGITSIGTYAFDYCYSLTCITIPDSVISIDESSFNSCYSLSSITIPDSVTSISGSTFFGCYSLSSVTIGNSVTSIGSSAFQNCSYMESIKFKPTQSPTVSSSSTWTNVPSTCTILVPIDTYSAYTTATNYPNPTTYTYLVFGTYESGATLPSSTTDNYMLIWYASIADAIAETNPITTGNGNEIYARCLAFVTRTTDFVNNTTSLNGDVSHLQVYSNMKRCNVADDGTINAYDGDVGYTEDGSNGQVMVYVRKFYYKLDVSEAGSLDGVNIRKGKWSISDTPDTGFKLHPAFIGTDGTTELDYFLYGAFEAVGQDNNGTYSTNYNTTSYKMGSVGGNAYEPIGNLDRPTARTMAANRGTGWYQAAVRQTMAVQMLFAVEYGFNSQLTLGQGFTASSNEDPLNTGTTTGSISSGSTNARIAVNYRGIENMWGNKWAWIDGLNMNSSTPYICDSYSFADNTTTGYTQIAFNCPANNYQSALGYDSNNDWVMLPSEASGANLSSAIGDYVYTSTGNLATLLGGDWSESTNAGVFCWNLSNVASGQFRRVGVRLMYIPS